MSEFGASDSSSSSDQRPPSPTPDGALLPPNNTVVVHDDDDHHPNNNNQQQLMLTPPTRGRPRGRPRGSKNKPKPPAVIIRDAEQEMRPMFVDVAAGSCIIDAILTFARQNSVGVSVMSAIGTFTGVSLRQPTPQAPLLSLSGPFTILSLHGTYIPGEVAAAAAPPAKASAAVHASANPSFGIVFSGSQGQIFGGVVAGRLVAASHVSVAVSTFANPTFHVMGSDDDDDDGDQDGKGDSGASGSGGGGGSDGHSGGGGGGASGVSTGMGVNDGGATPMSGQMTQAPQAGY